MKDTQTRLLDAALDLIEREGIRGTTTQKIAEKAGVSENTLFRHFGSKKKLLTEALRRETEILGKNVFSYTDNIEEDLESFISKYLLFIQKFSRVLPVIYAELPRYPEYATLLDAPKKELENIAAFLEHYQQKGYLHNESPVKALAALIGPLVFGAMLQRLSPDLDALPNATDHVHAFLYGRQHKE
ncbi:TetR/AcrR family transcriptional regulator [Risungbinella massiliensis]|uniref:TetR/AcrR family transcriptional regulator n=1 Tax=Risungbinella massiliensis TaxID=1329796 RepID=UPI00069AA309|nr:TetR/AcrR family transcriptional regulator [Risungbinella massiliensis]